MPAGKPSIINLGTVRDPYIKVSLASVEAFKLGLVLADPLAKPRPKNLLFKAQRTGIVDDLVKQRIARKLEIKS